MLVAHALACDSARGERCDVEYGVVLTCVEMGCCAQTVPGTRHELMRNIFVYVANSVVKKPYPEEVVVDYVSNVSGVRQIGRASCRERV